MRCLEEEFSGKQSTDVCHRRIAETGLYTWRSVAYVHLAASNKKGWLLRIQHINHENPKNGSMFFPVMSRNVHDQVILVKSLPGEKMWSSLSTLLRNKNRQIWWNEILEAYVRIFLSAISPYFIFMDDNAWQQRAYIVDELLEEEDIHRMDCPTRSPDLSSI
ncbi:hypothetical protein TNCV_3999931 [Trichonephila clavipes]|nr:hypothetical protein TNCV_3999931 [Trichonephila clavipes]